MVVFHCYAAGPASKLLPHRMLLVASEGLYVVERDGTCSRSYNVPRINGRSAVEFDDLVYDGQALHTEGFLYAAHRYVREVDRAGRTVWEYRVTGAHEIKSLVLRPDGRVAVPHSGEQAILELERGSGRELKRISVPASGSFHTRYNLLRLTPDDTYLLVLVAERRVVEVDRSGKLVNSFALPSLPTFARRLPDGNTLCSGQFGIKVFGPKGAERWSFDQTDIGEQFKLIYGYGVVPLERGRLLVVNSDWHYKEVGANRVPLFIVDQDKKIEWTLDVKDFGPWKKSEMEPRTGMKEHRLMMVQVLPDKP
jgi:hypothetical protein